MPERKIVIQTENGEHVTALGIIRNRKIAPFKEWAIIPCMTRASLKSYDMPTGVEAEIALVLLLRAHTTTRTSQIARILTRNDATVCRALKRLEKKGWAVCLERGEWKIHTNFAYYGRWLMDRKNGKHAS